MPLEKAEGESRYEILSEQVFKQSADTVLRCSSILVHFLDIERSASRSTIFIAAGVFQKQGQDTWMR